MSFYGKLNEIGISSDILIIGAGIIGLTIAYNLKLQDSKLSIKIIDKEDDVARHASGRNSGVLHAGLYYMSGTYKSTHCQDGAEMLRKFSIENNIVLNECGKVIVCQSENDIQSIHKLYDNARLNNIEVALVDEKQLSEIEPNAKTKLFAIYSPKTASFSPRKICAVLKQKLIEQGVQFYFNTTFLNKVNDNAINTNRGNFNFSRLINSGGIYSDKIARQYDFREDLILIPFKGMFLNVADMNDNSRKLKTHIYQVPNTQFRLLGAHVSPNYNNDVYIGPTAFPCLSKEHYGLISNLKFKEIKEVLSCELKLFISNQFNFRDLLYNEIKKQTRKGLLNSVSAILQDNKKFKPISWGMAGINPRLYDLHENKIIDDFYIHRYKNSLHIVNSVSPAFTTAFSFSKYIVGTFN